jgi:putative membrane protein
VVAVRRFTNGNSAPKQPDALDVLRDRFAKGEIDEEEFQKRKSTLES